MATQKVKLLYVLEFLARESDENHPINAEKILAFLEEKGIHCERKSIYSDIKVLREYGYDILSTKGNQNGYFLASRTFETVEIQLLADAVESAKFISPKKTEQLLQKILLFTSRAHSEEIQTHCHVESSPKAANEEIYYHIDKLSRAIREQKKIHVLYRRHKADKANASNFYDKEYTVSPYAMIWSNDCYYLVANYEKYDDLMVLRIDRIRSMDIVEGESARHFKEVSEYTEVFDSADYAKKHFNMYAGSTEPVEMICQNDVIEQVIDQFGDHIHLYCVDEAHFGMQAEIAVNDGLIAWLLQFGTRIEVKKPEYLKKLLLKRVTEIQNLYSKV